jgi:hypothetical protein
LAFPISFGVRRADKDGSAHIEMMMHKRAPEIKAILAENGVPLADDSVQCAPLHQHASTDRGPLVQLVADAATYPDADPAYARQRLVAQTDQSQQTGHPQTSASDSVDCKGTETMQGIEKLAGGSPPPGKPYTVQDGKVNATTYTGWLRYAAFCQACHGTGGVGSAIAPDLTQAMKSLNKRQFETIVSPTSEIRDEFQSWRSLPQTRQRRSSEDRLSNLSQSGRKAHRSRRHPQGRNDKHLRL